MKSLPALRRRNNSRILFAFAAETAGAERLQAVALQTDFLKQALLSWLPQFEARCQALRTHTISDFYPAAASLLLAFVTLDAATLGPTDQAA